MHRPSSVTEGRSRGKLKLVDNEQVLVGLCESEAPRDPAAILRGICSGEVHDRVGRRAPARRGGTVIILAGAVLRYYESSEWRASQHKLHSRVRPREPP